VPVIIGIVAVLLVCCAGFAATGFFVLRSHGGFTITGDMTLTGGGAGTEGSSCQGTGDYDDINKGTEVVVSDPGGKTLATGRLRAGTTQAGDCVFPFTVHRVPKDKSFYGVTISHRGTLNYSQTDLKEPLHLAL
jgi:hypothetical protein